MTTVTTTVVLEGYKVGPWKPGINRVITPINGLKEMGNWGFSYHPTYRSYNLQPHLQLIRGPPCQDQPLCIQPYHISWGERCVHVSQYSTWICLKCLEQVKNISQILVWWWFTRVQSVKNTKTTNPNLNNKLYSILNRARFSITFLNTMKFTYDKNQAPAPHSRNSAPGSSA